MARHLKINFGRIIFSVLLLLFFIFVAVRFSQAQQVAHQIFQFHWYVILLLLILEALALWGRGQVYRTVYNKMGIKMSSKEAFYLHIASYTVNVLAPSGGISGVGIFVSDALRRGVKRSRAVISSFIYYLTEYINLALLVLASIIYMFLANRLQMQYVTIFIIFAVILIGLVAIFIWLVGRKHLFIKLMSGLIRVINVFLKLIRLKIISQESAYRAHESCIELAVLIKRDKTVLIVPWLIFLAVAICEILMLKLVYYALGAAIPLEALLVGYSLGLLVITISVTPAGIGIAEPTMAVIFVSLGADLRSSVIAILIFRAITTWLPLVPGVLILEGMTNNGEK